MLRCQEVRDERMAQITNPPSAPPSGPSNQGRSASIAVVVLGAVAIALAVALVIAVGGDDDDADVITEETTSSVTEPASETTGPPSTSEPGTTEAPTTAPGSSVNDAEAATISWPDPADGAAYDDPVQLATDFAEEVLGFTSPVVGELQEGDSRSGEVEVRPSDAGPVTTVAVRRMSDDALYVLFAATSEVELLLPTAGSAIDHPLEVEGWGRGFEGQVRVAVFDRTSSEELGHGFFTAGGEGELAAFNGEVAWENPGGGWGVVVASVHGGPDGTTWAASAFPVGYIGGD